MKKSGLMFAVFLILGIITGAVLTAVLDPVQGISFLTRSAVINWKPSADLNVLTFNINITIRMNLLSVACMITSIWLYRKM
ncbi:DUF4321 domain-containing protein [Gorillibacterium massiliense]|uniref:DUF4321 domain-containing protein n=1 Tax=Gorillibacterium massiliense TaxID=1280390 RepID=UPI0004AD392F|nr:DUF4321 domain-containing protein [Gorillibacterium massiliense]